MPTIGIDIYAAAQAIIESVSNTFCPLEITKIQTRRGDLVDPAFCDLVLRFPKEAINTIRFPLRTSKASLS